MDAILGELQALRGEVAELKAKQGQLSSLQIPQLNAAMPVGNTPPFFFTSPTLPSNTAFHPPSSVVPSFMDMTFENEAVRNLKMQMMMHVMKSFM